MDSLLFLAVMALAVTILGLSKGGFAGIGMVSTPMVAAVSDPLTAVAIMLPIMMVQDGVAVWLYRHSFDGNLLRRMIPGAVLGVVLAYLLATTVPERGVLAVLGGISLMFSVWQLATFRHGIPSVVVAGPLDIGLGWAAGAAGGFASAIAHAGSPPFQIYVMPRQLPKEVYVGTSVMFFAAVNLLKLPSFVALGLFDSATLGTSALFLPLAVGSSWAGARLVRHIDARRFNLVVTIILLLISLELIRQALA